MKKISFIAFACFYFAAAIGQSEKTVIAVLPFVTNLQGVNPDLVQEMVTQQFVKTGRFDIVDRSKFQKVITELNVQKSEEFLNSKIVDQGKLLGAQYLVTGVVTQMNPSTREIVSTTTALYPLYFMELPDHNKLPGY